MYTITDDQVHRLITMRDAIDTMRSALAEQGRHRAKIQPRVRTLGENVSLISLPMALRENERQPISPYSNRSESRLPMLHSASWSRAGRWRRRNPRVSPQPLFDCTKRLDVATCGLRRCG